MLPHLKPGFSVQFAFLPDGLDPDDLIRQHGPAAFQQILDTKTSPLFDETATITSSSTFTSGSLFDVGVGLRLWKNLTVGVAYHQEQNDTDGTLTGSIPSPVFFNRPRTLTATVEGLDRKEQATRRSVRAVVAVANVVPH